MDRVGQQRDGAGDATTTSACSTAVTSRTTRLILTARMPSALASNAASTESTASWLWGRSTDRSRPHRPCRVPMAVAVVMAVPCGVGAVFVGVFVRVVPHEFIIPAVRPIWQNWTSNSQLLVAGNSDRGAPTYPRFRPTQGPDSRAWCGQGPAAEKVGGLVGGPAGRVDAGRGSCDEGIGQPDGRVHGEPGQCDGAEQACPVRRVGSVKKLVGSAETPHVVVTSLRRDYVFAGSQGWPSASMTRVSKKFCPCLAAVDR